LLATGLLPALAVAQGGPVSIVVATSAGTGVDIIGRVMGEQLAKQMGVPFVVDNRPGASGNIGAEHAAHAAPDGRTLFVGATTFATNASLNTHIPYDPIKDFVPISLMGTGTMSLAVSPTLPVKSVRDFVEMAKAQPGKINYASPGNGTPQHLAMELFKLETGTDLFHVPYKSTGGALTDLAGGHVSAMIVPVDSAMPLAAAGKIKILAVMSAERFAGLPDVPTFSEQGYPKLKVNVWYGLFAPAGTPAATIDKFNRNVDTALKKPDVIATLDKQGIAAVGGPPQRMADLLKSELTRWPAVVKAAHITVD
jgi:tripartite-type tricarboxylate transporter receptor subunit TctC